MQETNNSSSNLWIGIILGILILGGIYLYMTNNTAQDAGGDKAGSIKTEVTLPTGDGEAKQ